MSLIRNFILIFILLVNFPFSAYSQNTLDIPVIMKGACPFECCTYTNWTAENDIRVYQSARDTASSSFIMTKDGEFKAVTGNVYITEPGLVIAKKSFVISDVTPKWEVERKDTLFLLDYQGEGYYNVFFQGKHASISDHYWYNRRVKESDETELAKQLKTAKTEWWVKIVDSNNREGWIFMDQAQVLGHDACR